MLKFFSKKTNLYDKYQNESDFYINSAVFLIFNSD